MRVMGVRELKAHLSEALEAVALGEVIEVTNHGHRVARLVPINRQADAQEIAEALASVNRLAAEIGKYAPPDLTAEQILDDIRK